MLASMPQRIFLDTSILQTLQDYGGFLYEFEPLHQGDSVLRDISGFPKLSALRNIMQVALRAPFEFAISENSLAEVHARGDRQYLRWAYDVLDHWLTCLSESQPPQVNRDALVALNSGVCGYLSDKDCKLIKDAVLLECDTFLTMENRLPKQAKHMKKVLGIRVGSPIDIWKDIEPWANIFL